MTNSINLNEISLPLRINEEISEFNEMFQQGSISSAVKVEAELKKISLKEFNFSGLIRGELESKCQYCLERIKVQIKIDSNVIIQDLDSFENSNTDFDVHLQNLDSFRTNELCEELKKKFHDFKGIQGKPLLSLINEFLLASKYRKVDILTLLLMSNEDDQKLAYVLYDVLYITCGVV